MQHHRNRLVPFPFVLAAVAAISLLLHVSVGLAQEDPDVLVEEANELFLNGEFREAAELFERAYELDRHPIIRYNHGRCMEELGELPQALNLFREALALNPSANVTEAITGKIAEVEAVLIEQGYNLDRVDRETFGSLSRLTITSIPTGATVQIEGESIGQTPIQGLFIASGEYDLEIRLEGYLPHSRTVEIEASRNASVHAGMRREETVIDYQPPEPGYLILTGPRRGMDVFLDEDYLGETPVAAMAIPPGRYLLRVRHVDYEDWDRTITIESDETVTFHAATASLIEEERGIDAHDIGFITLGVGGAALATGVVLGVIASADADRYQRNVNVPYRNEIRESALDEAKWADVSFITAGVLLTTSVVLLFIVEVEPDPNEIDDLVLFDVTPNGEGWGFSLGTTF